MRLRKQPWNKEFPLIMGIMNFTPDSFSDGGTISSVDDALYRAEALINDGADILDIGAESSRPGAESISDVEEISRLEPFLTAYVSRFDTPISIDTVKSTVAEMSLSKGASMINDISGLCFDCNMATVVARYKVPVVIMHMLGQPKTMQINPSYTHVSEAVYEFFTEALKKAKRHGIEDVILDPGIGFGKTVQHNLTLLNTLDSFLALNCPLLIGTSRKSFIGSVINEPDPLQRLEGSLATCLYAYSKGAKLFRVHDVKATKRALNMWQALEGNLC